LVQQSKVSKLL